MISLVLIWRRAIHHFLCSLTLFVGIGVVYASLYILWCSVLGWFYFWVHIGQKEHFWII